MNDIFLISRLIISVGEMLEINFRLKLAWIPSSYIIAVRLFNLPE